MIKFRPLYVRLNAVSEMSIAVMVDVTRSDLRDEMEELEEPRELLRSRSTGT